MARPKSKKEPIGLRLDKSLVKELDEMLVRMFGDKMNRSWAIEKAIREFIVAMQPTVKAIEQNRDAGRKAADAKRKKG